MKFVRLALLLLVFGTQTAAQKPTAAPIGTLMAELVSAFNTRDAAKAASFYAEDAVWMPPDAPMIQGRANIESALKNSLQRGGLLKLSVLESQIAGNTAFAAGTFTMTISSGVAVPARILRGTTHTEAGTAVQTLAAKYLTVFKRVGNDWKIAYDMQNADGPPPGR